ISDTNGVVAFSLVVAAMGIEDLDKVIIQFFKVISTAIDMFLAGALLLLVDVDLKTWYIDPTKIEQKITPRTKAIMAVHMYGHPCDMTAIMKIARRHNLYVIEDCAIAHGAEVNGQKVGTFGDVAGFSFYGNKIVTTGEGGLVLCNDDRLSERLRFLQDQCVD